MTAYATAVVDGSVVAGPHIRAAGARHIKDLKRKDLFFDVAAAVRAINFFSDVLTVEKEQIDEYGNMESVPVPFVLEWWQAFIVGSLFGWKKLAPALVAKLKRPTEAQRRASQVGMMRRFRRAFVEIGKGNGKSPLAAGIGHYMLSATGKLRAEVYSAATDKDQAAILFRDAVEMWKRSPSLRKRLVASGINPVWQLTNIDKASFFKPISSEKKGKSGIRPYCALIDEVHEHPDNSVIEKMRAGTKGNQEALIFEITNSGFDRLSVCWNEHQYSVEIAQGIKENDTWFSFVAGVDEGDDPFEDETCWIKANPNLGVSIQPAFIREQVAEAQGMPSKEGYVRRLHFCEWTDSEKSAIPRKLWQAAQLEKDYDFLALSNEGIRPFGGLDLSRVMDLCAFTLTWMTDTTKDAWHFKSKTWFWTPKDTLAERAKRDKAPYEEWAKDGWLDPVPGKRVSYKWLADTLAGIITEYNPELIGCDQYGLQQLNDQFDEIGFSAPCMVHPQGFQRRIVGTRGTEDNETGETGAEEIALWMPDSILKLEAGLLEGRLKHDPNPVQSLCATGTVYRSNATGHRMFDKDKATSRIDGMVSLAMSIGTATLNVNHVPFDAAGMIG